LQPNCDPADKNSLHDLSTGADLWIEQQRNLSPWFGLLRSIFHFHSTVWLNRRSLLAVENLIDAILWSLQSPSALRELFLIADPEPMSVRDMFVTLRKARGRGRDYFPFRWMVLVV